MCLFLPHTHTTPDLEPILLEEMKTNTINTLITFMSRTDHEEEQLKSVVSELTDAEKETIFNRGIELLQEQNKPSDLSCLPSLHIDEVRVCVGRSVYPR